MAAEAPRAAAAVPGSGAGGLEPGQALGPAQPGQPSPSPKATGLCQLAPHWNRRGVLLTLGASHIAVGVLHAVLGGYLAFLVKNVHLVMLKSWFPLWGPASFLLSGVLAIAVAGVSKTSLKALCLIANLLSFLCGLAGLWVLAKDLFLEKPSPGGPPIWRPYPNSTVHIQRLQQVLFSLTWLELLLPGVTAIFSAVDGESAESDDLPPLPAVELVTREPPPSYEEVAGGGTRAWRSSSEEAWAPQQQQNHRVLPQGAPRGQRAVWRTGWPVLVAEVVGSPIPSGTEGPPGSHPSHTPASGWSGHG